MTARSSMFFQSDAYAASETAAWMLEEHGLTSDEVQALADALHDTITGWFSEHGREIT